jgi:hypothetical protein
VTPKTDHNGFVHAVNGTDKSRYPSNVMLDPMKLHEYKSLNHNSTVWVICRDGKARQVRVSGMPKTWKTRFNDVRVPVKYGMYDSAYIGTLGDCITGYILVKEY